MTFLETVLDGNDAGQRGCEKNNPLRFQEVPFMRDVRVSILVVLAASLSTGLAWAQPEPTEPQETETSTIDGEKQNEEERSRVRKRPPFRFRIPMVRGMAGQGSESATAESSHALAPSHGAAVPPPPPESVPPGSTVATEPVLMPPPRVYEFGDPNVGVDGHPLAGYHGGLFYLRNRTDFFRLFLRSRLHIDSYNYFGPGVKHTDLKSTMLLRRARVELGGEIMGHWQWEFQFEAGPTGFSNSAGTDQTSAGPAGTDPTATTASYASPQGVRYSARPIHAYVNYRASDAFNIKVGQFNVPFTAENRTSTNSIPFMERALTSRTWGVPLVKDIGGMVWGHLDKRTLFWSWAVLQGEGENRPNADNRAMTAMRVYTRPLAQSEGPLDKLQIGGSFKYAMHDKDRVAYDYPALATQSGYRYWTPTYTDSVGSGRRVHIIPSGAQLGAAAELRVPFDRFDLRSEYVYLKNNTREGVDGFQSTHTERFGTLKGHAYHVTLSYWLLGEPFLTGIVGDRRPPRLRLDKPDPGIPPHGVELVLRWEQLRATYEGASRSGQPDEKNVDGDIRTDIATVGMNYWASQHLRLTVNYALNRFPGSSASSSPSQRAKAPANRLAPGLDDEARESAHTLHEVAARIAVAF